MGRGNGCKNGDTRQQHKSDLRKDALSRQANYDSLTIAEKIARLPNDGAISQRKRLTAKL